MNTEIRWMFGSLLVVVISASIFVTSFLYFIGDLKTRLYPQGNTQDLVTADQLEKKLSKSEYDGYFYDGTNKIQCNIIKQDNEYDGYFYDSTGKIRSNIVEQDREDMWKVGYLDPPNKSKEKIVVFKIIKWIPKKDFHRYYTIEELSEIVNEKK